MCLTFCEILRRAGVFGARKWCVSCPPLHLQSAVKRPAKTRMCDPQARLSPVARRALLDLRLERRLKRAELREHARPSRGLLLHCGHLRGGVLSARPRIETAAFYLQSADGVSKALHHINALT